MTTWRHANSTAIQPDAIDAFLAFARTYLTSTEQLTAIVPNIGHGAPGERVAMTTAATATGDVAATATPLTVSQSMLKRTLTYSRDTVHELVTRAHREAAQLVTREIVCRAFH